MPSGIQRSFAGGEIAPALYGRADQAKYQTGLRTCKNFIVRREGGVTNRAGTEFIAEVKDSTKTVRLLKFVFDEDTSFVLEVGDGYMRFFQNGAAVNISAPAAYNGGTTYAIGDLVSYSGVNYYSEQSGNTGNQPDISPTWWHPLAGTIYEIPSPYGQTDVGALKFTQLGDVITLAHASYPPYELKRFGTTDWTLTKVVFGPTIGRGRNAVGTPGAAGSNTYQYQVIAMGPADEQGLPATEATVAITGISQADPGVVTMGGDQSAKFQDGDLVVLEGMTGMDELIRRTFLIDNVTVIAGPNTTFELVDEDTTAYTAWVSGGTAGRTIITVISAAEPTAANPHVITWDAVTDAVEYRVFRALNGVFGEIGRTLAISAGSLTFNDTNITPDVSITPPIEKDLFYRAGLYPSAVGYMQQRLGFANNTEEPQRGWASQIGRFGNFNVSAPLQDDDAISFVATGDRVFEIKHMLEAGRPLALSAGAETTLEGGGLGTITPTEVNPKTNTYQGSSDARPIVIGNAVLFVQARGRVVRDLRFEFESGGYRGNELSIFASHFFDEPDDDILYWDYQQVPHSIVWAVKTDGQLVGLTYQPDQQVWGWHRHSTTAGDKFLDVVSVPERHTIIPYEGVIAEDSTYLLVERLVGGSAVKYIERMGSRESGNFLVEYRFLDSSLVYNGTQLTLAGYDPAATAQLTTAGGWTIDDDLTLTMSEDTFVAGDVGNGMWMFSPATLNPVFVTITVYTSAKIVTVRPDRTVPAVLQSLSTIHWFFAKDTFTGLDHLEAEVVGIVADGNVQPDDTVASGEITIERPAAIVVVGKRYVSEIETLDPEPADRSTMLDKQKRVNMVTVLVESSRGMWIGQDTDSLVEWKQRAGESYDNPVAHFTGPVKIRIKGKWQEHGRIVIQQVDPLPLTILGIAPSGLVGE